MHIFVTVIFIVFNFFLFGDNWMRRQTSSKHYFSSIFQYLKKKKNWLIIDIDSNNKKMELRFFGT